RLARRPDADRAAARRHPHPARELVFLLPADDVDPDQRHPDPDPHLPLPPLSGALGAAAAALASLLVAAPALAAEPIRVAVGDGLRTLDLAAADLITVQEPHGRRPLFGIPGGHAVRVSPRGGALELVWGSAPRDRRRVAMSAIRLESRRGPLAAG